MVDFFIGVMIGFISGLFSIILGKLSDYINRKLALELPETRVDLVYQLRDY